MGGVTRLDAVGSVDEADGQRLVAARCGTQDSDIR
jgi:hypothetical protein